MLRTVSDALVTADWAASSKLLFDSASTSTTLSTDIVILLAKSSGDAAALDETSLEQVGARCFNLRQASGGNLRDRDKATAGKAALICVTACLLRQAVGFIHQPDDLIVGCLAKVGIMRADAEQRPGFEKTNNLIDLFTQCVKRVWCGDGDSQDQLARTAAPHGLADRSPFGARFRPTALVLGAQCLRATAGHAPRCCR